MALPLSESTLSSLSAFLAKEMGLLFPRERWGELERGFAAAARQMGCRDSRECIERLTKAPLTRPQIETLAGVLTVGETYFFRDPHTMQMAESEILPALIRSRRGKDRRLRLWSAGCSTGEEPYSIAIMLHRLLPDLDQWNITLLATDINTASLNRAIDGVYGRWSFRGTPASLERSYFTEEPDGRLKVVEKVRRLVSFEYLNLAADSYPSLATNTNAMDLIFCRNVLMYFSAETVRSVLGKLYLSLVDNGWLVVSPAEHLPRRYASFQAVDLAGSICYRKRGEEAEAPGAGPEQSAAQVTPAAAPGALEIRELPPQVAGGGAEAAARGYRMAVALYRQGHYQQAAERLDGLRVRRELPAEGVALLIRAHANRGELSAALEVCEAALLGDKLDPALHFLRAEILQEQGMRAEAQHALERALYLDHRLVLAHFALGNLALREGSRPRAARHFQNAFDLLRGAAADSILPGSEGMTAGRLREIIASMNGELRPAQGGRG